MDLPESTVKVQNLEESKHDSSELTANCDSLHAFEIHHNLHEDLVLCDADNSKMSTKSHLELEHEHIITLSDSDKDCVPMNTDYCLEDELHPIDTSQDLIAP